MLRVGGHVKLRGHSPPPRPGVSGNTHCDDRDQGTEGCGESGRLVERVYRGGGVGETGVVRPVIEVRGFRELGEVYGELERGDIVGRVVLRVGE